MGYELTGRIKLDGRSAIDTLDRISRQTDRASRSTDTFRDSMGRLRSSNGRFVRDTEKATKSMKDFEAAGKKTFTSLSKMAKGTTLAFAGLAAVGLGAGIALLGSSMKKAMDFEAQLSSIQALTNATDAQMKSMQDLALLEGARTKYSALEAAQAIEELVKAGLKPAQVESGALGAALDLATAGELQLADAAAIMSTALNAFKSNGLTASQAADILAGTANSAAATVYDLQYGLAAVGAVADGVGMSFRDTSAALGIFANNGLKSQDAGTSLKTMLMNLSPATDKAYEAMRYLGIITKEGNNQFYDAEGRLRSLTDVADVLQRSLSKFSDKDRQDFFREMFGTDAIRAANILYKEGSAGVKSFYQDMSRVTALEVARKKMDNAAGSVEELQGAIETLQISALLPTMPIIRDLADAAATLVTKYGPQITTAMENAVSTARKYLDDTFINNPEFQKLPDLESKVNFVFAEMRDVFNEWWSNGGAKQTEDAVRRVTEFLVDVLATTGPKFVEVGAKLGASFTSGFLKGLDPMTYIDNHMVPSDWMHDMFDATNKYLPQFMGGVSDEELVYKNAERRNSVGNTNGTPMNMFAPKTIPAIDLANPFKPKASGIDNVPYNQYPASLHKGEAVLTRGEADEYRRERDGKGSSGSVTITGNTFVIREEADIDKIARQLAREMAF